MKLILLLIFMLPISCKIQQRSRKSMLSHNLETSKYNFDKVSDEACELEQEFDIDPTGHKKETCDSSEDLEKKVNQSDQDAFNLQGGDTGCEVE